MLTDQEIIALQERKYIDDETRQREIENENFLQSAKYWCRFSGNPKTCLTSNFGRAGQTTGGRALFFPVTAGGGPAGGAPVRM